MSRSIPRSRIPLALFALLAPFALAAGDCDDLPEGDMSTPQYWGEYFLNKYEDERQASLDHVEEGPAPLEEPRVVLLITGVTIPAEWFDNIVVRLERDGFIPVVYEPPELLSGSLFQASEDLADVVKMVQQESGQDKIDILAECTGGVIARHYVQSLGGDAYVDRLVTFVSPQNGIDKAALAEDIVGWPALVDLTPGSEFLTAVQSVPLPDSVTMTSIYTCGDEYIKPYETSIVEGATNIGLCDEFVGHFQTMYDPAIYLIMHEALVLGLDDAPEHPEDEPEEDNGLVLADTPVEVAELVVDIDAEDPSGDENAGGCSTGPSPSGLGVLMLGAVLLAVRRRRPS